MIKISELTDQDVGRYVIYLEDDGDILRGQLKTWNKRSLGIVFDSDAAGFYHGGDAAIRRCDPRDVDFE